MSQKRTVFLAGFGVLAVAVLLAIAYWPPSQDDSASGAIGAVEKHRQQQIAKKDVVLGDEKTRAEERLVYGDFLSDATKLGNVSAELSAMLQSFDAQTASKSVASFQQELASHASELQARYLESARAELGAIEALVANRAEAGSMTAELQSIEKQLGARELGAKELANIAAELGSVVKELGSAYMESRNLGNIESSLNAIATDVANKAELGSVEKQLGSAAAELQSSIELANFAAVENRQEYLGAMALEAKAIENAHSELAAFAEMGNRADLENAAEMLGAHADELQNRALEAMEARMESRMTESRSLENIDAALNSIEKGLQARASELGAKAVENASRELGSIEAAVANRTSELQNRLIGSMQMELGAIDAQLQARGTENRVFEAKTLGSFDAYLQNISDALASRAAGNRELADRAAELQNRATELQARADN